MRACSNNSYPANILGPENEGVLHLLHLFKIALQTNFDHGCKHYEPRSDCFLGSSLICVHIVCNASIIR